MTSKKDSKRFKAPATLQQKAGPGPLNMEAVERAQLEIQSNKIDFSPMGLEFLKQLESAIQFISKNNTPSKLENNMKSIIGPVMELKANAAIFHYPLVGSLSSIMLSFLETIKELDDDALSIVQGHHDSLKAILTNKMKGDGGQNGKIMANELADACSRYHRKKKKQG